MAWTSASLFALPVMKLRVLGGDMVAEIFWEDCLDKKEGVKFDGGRG